MTEEIKHEVKGLEDLSEAEIADDLRMKTVVLRVRDFTDAKGESKDAKGEGKDAKGESKDAKGESKDAKGEDADRKRSVVFNAYNLALHSGLFCDALSLTFPYEAGSTAPCIENIDFSAIPDDPYTDERSIITVPVGDPNSPVTVDSLKFIARFVNATEPVEPVGKNFKWFPPSSYMEIIYQGYETIPELMKYLQDANALGFHSLAYFLASEVAEQLRMYASGRELTRADVDAFERGEVWTPNHDTRRRALMLEDQRSDRVVNAILEEMRRSEGKRA